MADLRAKPLRAALFDMDGTLADTFPGLIDVFNVILKKHGRPPIDRAEFVARLGPTEDVMLGLLLEGVRGADPLQELIDATASAPPLIPFNGIPDVVSRCRAAGLAVGVFTGAGKILGRKRLELTGLGSMIDAFVGGDEVPQSKPAPDGLFLLCERLGITPAESIFFGDSILDIRSAKAAGVRAVGVSWGVASVKALQSEGPDAILHAPPEIAVYLGLK